MADVKPRPPVKVLEFFIPGYVPPQNTINSEYHFGKAAVVKKLRKKAFLFATNALNRARLKPFTGPATITFEVRRLRLLDEGDNEPSVVKHFRDGLCSFKWRKAYPPVPGVLPNGDGPRSGYRFIPATQVQVKTRAEEGVVVRIVEEVQ